MTTATMTAERGEDEEGEDEEEGRPRKSSQELQRKRHQILFQKRYPIHIGMNVTTYTALHVTTSMIEGSNKHDNEHHPAPGAPD